jgi:hypothetical protein
MLRRAIRSSLTITLFVGIMISSLVGSHPADGTVYAPLSGGTSNLGGNADEAGYSLKLTRDTGLIFAGYTKSWGYGGSDIWLIKTGLYPYKMDNGVTGAFQKEQWNVTYGGSKDDGAYSVIQTSDNGYAVAGFTFSFGAGESDAWLVKVNAHGGNQWNRTFGGVGNDVAKCLVQTGDGGFLLVGYTNSNVHSQSTWVIKTDSEGNVQWNRIYSGKGANSVVLTSDAKYVLAVDYADSFGLIEIDSSGNELLNKKFEPSNFSTVSTQGIIEASDGGYVLTGWVSNESGGQFTWLVKTDPMGKLEWSKVLSDLGASDIVKLENGGYALTGDRAFLILTDPDGNVEWNTINDGNPSNDSRYASLYSMSMQQLIEASPNHFVMIGTSDSGEYGQLQLSWIQIALKSGDQTYPPQTTILSPSNTTYDKRNIPLNFYVNESTNHLSYSLCGLNNSTISGNTTLQNLPNGDYSITIYATDQDFNTGASQTVSFNVRSDEPYIAPVVTIQSPENQVYNTSQLELTFLVNQDVAWTAFSVDGGQNQTVPAGVHISFFTSNGTHTLTVYAGQRPNDAGSAVVAFTVNNPQQTFYSTPYPQFNVEAERLLRTLSENIVAFFSSTAFLAIAIIFLFLTVCTIIVITITTKKPNTNQRS